MAHTQTISHISLIGLACALGLCGGQLSFGQAFSDRLRWLLGRSAEAHGDDDEDDDEGQEQDEEGEEDDEDDEDEEEPWQVRAPAQGS